MISVQRNSAKNQEQEFNVRNAKLIAEEETQVQNYAEDVIQRANEFGQSYLVHDETGVLLPSYACSR